MTLSFHFRVSDVSLTHVRLDRSAQETGLCGVLVLDTMDEPPNVVEIERVRCLECGNTYSRPAGRRTVDETGCPSCGYLGWIPAAIPPIAPRRSAADLPQTQEAQPR